MVTYTRADEPGTSLRAAGWRRAAELPPRGDWHPARQPGRLGPARVRWEVP
ncbi:hypothetical protein [Nocardiopsis halophila]|uniref:hypothetical protein n=1 Tax=Nocardiopsis halophila TaxID=141692 RepID=UPI00034A91E9|nr:hypothetical protein [Nocardiopsis halophila]